MLSAKKELFTPSGGGYQISRSVRLRSSASAYFTRTPSVAGNRRTFTISAWVKKGRVDDTAAGVQASSLFGAGNTGNVAGFKFAMGDVVQGTNTQIFSSQETIHNVSNQFVWYGTERYRDSSAWYHVVVAFDTPQATASNRLKIWVNGQQIGAGNYTVALAQNQDLSWNNTVPQFIGASTTNSAPWLTYFDGLLAEVYSVDGQALTPSSFGETNAITGVWQPKRYAGTYGTNGFYLPFSDNSGADSFGIGVDKSAEALNRVELGNTSVGYTILGTMTFALAGAAQVHLRDNNPSTAAADPAGLSASTALGYDFGRAIKIRKIATLTAAANGTSVTSIFNIQYSDDNVTWTTVTGSATTHTFSAGLAQSNTTDIDDNGSHRYWRLKYLSGTTAGNFWIATLDMYVNNIGPNSWFPVNISTTAGATYDSMIDVPTLYADGGNGRGNYCTLNPLATSTIYTTSKANLQVSGAATSSATHYCHGTLPVSTGKWYFEVTPTDVGGGPNIYVGVKLPNTSVNNVGAINTIQNGYGYGGDGNKISSGVVAYGATYTNNDVVGVALDLDAGTIVFYKNNVSQGTAFTGLTGEFVPVIAMSVGGTARTIAAEVNFGQRPFTYTPPTGFKALNTQNLPTPTISNGANYMAATLYTGTGASQSVSNSVNGISFQPDMVWVKDRSAARSHVLIDAVRGTGLTLFPNETTADQSNTDRITSFNSNGFSVGAGLGTNANTETYVGWQWNAGGSTVTNTSGSISAQVRANPTAGFSVVTGTFPSTGTSCTFGHGLGVAPSMIISKGRDGGTSNWIVRHTSLGNMTTKYLEMNNTGAVGTGPNAATAPSSTIASVSTDGLNNNMAFVAYCFAAVAGYSAFGSYTGNGSADGPFVFTNFRPRWVMIKCYDVAGEHWIIYDTARNTYNVVTNELYANLSNAEATYAPGLLDVTANGFKLRYASAPNASGRNYIYAAFAENPFKHSLAR